MSTLQRYGPADALAVATRPEAAAGSVALLLENWLAASSRAEGLLLVDHYNNGSRPAWEATQEIKLLRERTVEALLELRHEYSDPKRL